VRVARVNPEAAAVLHAMRVPVLGLAQDVPGATHVHAAAFLLDRDRLLGAHGDVSRVEPRAFLRGAATLLRAEPETGGGLRP